jgi:hypothetical protein
MRVSSTVSVAVILLAGVARANDLKSGPQVGNGVPGGFVTTFLNGPHADKRRCPV